MLRDRFIHSVRFRVMTGSRVWVRVRVGSRVRAAPSGRITLTLTVP